MLTQDTIFNFDQWIIDNKLDDIKDIFIKYGMTTIASLSDESDLYRNFFKDHELRQNYSNLMPVAIKAIDELNKAQNKQYEQESDDNDNYDDKQDDNDPNYLVKQHSLELCNDKFGEFLGKYLKKKLMNKIWPTLDPEDNGYIENVDDIANGIGFIAALYKQHEYKKTGLDKKPKDERQEIQKQADQIALWVCKSFGTVSKNDKSDNIEYKYKVTKREFQHNLPKWVQQYAESEGTL